MLAYEFGDGRFKVRGLGLLTSSQLESSGVN